MKNFHIKVPSMDACKELWIQNDKLLRIKYSNRADRLLAKKSVSGGGAVHFLEEKDFFSLGVLAT